MHMNFVCVCETWGVSKNVCTDYNWYIWSHTVDVHMSVFPQECILLKNQEQILYFVSLVPSNRMADWLLIKLMA